MSETNSIIPATSQFSKLTGQTTMDIEGELKAHIAMLLFWGRQYWKPLHDRMDYGLTLYLLLDPIQQAKPVGFRRYVSNDPRTAVDTAVNLLTRNYPYWRGDMPTGMNETERRKVGKIEQAMSGIVDAYDYLFLHRGDAGGRFWRQAAWFALMRGWIWGKFQVTKQASKWGLKTPLLGEFYDPRQVFPHYDGIGLESVVILKETNMNEMMMQYGRKVREILHINSNAGGQGQQNHIDPNARATRVEYWSNDRVMENDDGTTYLRKGQYCVLGYFMTSSIEAGLDPIQSMPDAGFATWLVDPIEHGYSPDALPVIGVPVNGIPLKMKPAFGQGVLSNMNLRAQQLRSPIPTWHDPSGYVAESGRGLMTSVEELLPQYNELIATIFQHFTIGTYGTWVFKTQTGQLPEFEDGSNAKVPLRIGEDVQRFVPEPINADAYKLIDIVQDEKKRGLLDTILQANGALSAASGIVLQQTINAALNGLNAYAVGLEDFGTMFSEHILEQLKMADTGTLALVSRGASKTYNRLEFDPKTDLEDRKYHMAPIFKPALPEDIMTKAQAATLLLNPRNPIMSILTVLREVFQLEDPEGELDRMLEDIANRDPVILLERIATVLDEEGEPEMAQRIRQKEFQAKFSDDLQQKQMDVQQQQLDAQSQQQGQQGPPGGPGAGAPTGGPPGTGGPPPNPDEAEPGGPGMGGPGATGAGQPRPGQGGGVDLNPGGGLGVIGG